MHPSGLAILALVPLLGYMLLVTQRWAFREEAASRQWDGDHRREGGGASWMKGDDYGMSDSVFAVLFMIAIGAFALLPSLLLSYCCCHTA